MTVAHFTTATTLEHDLGVAAERAHDFVRSELRVSLNRLVAEVTERAAVPRSVASRAVVDEISAGRLVMGADRTVSEPND